MAEVEEHRRSPDTFLKSTIRSLVLAEMGSVASAVKVEFLTPKPAITHVTKLPEAATATLQAKVDVLEATRCTDAQSEAEQLLHQEAVARRTRGL